MSPAFRRPFLSLALVAFSGVIASAADEIQWISISLPPTATAGDILQFNATVKNTGTTTWDGNCYLELADSSGIHLNYPSVAGVAPGQTVSRMFLLYLPGNATTKTYTFKGLRHNVAYFGATQTRTISVQTGPVNDGVRLAVTPVNGRYLLDPTAPPLPVIDSTDPLTPDYRLRAKIIDGTQYGFHAATTWNNKGLPLDFAPPAGDYPIASLYWLKYDSWNGTLLEIGQERLVAVSVPGNVLALSTYCFGQLQPPQISISGTLAGTYWLSAKFRNASGAEWDTTPRPANAAVDSNNQNAILVNLPPPGDYTVELSYRRWDAAGNVVVTSPITSKSAVVYGGGGVVLSTLGETTRDWGQNENGDWENQDHPGEHQFQVMIPGNLQVTISALFDSTTELLKRSNNNDDEPVANWGGGASGTIAVTPGTYTLRIHGGPGAYHATAIVTTTLAAPVFSSNTAGTASGTFGTEFSGYVASATGGGDITYALVNPPPGLSIVTQGGMGFVTGRPTAVGFFPATLTATNGIDTVAKAVIFTIGKAVPKAEFPNVIAENQSLWYVTQAMLTGANGEGGARFRRPDGMPEHLPAPTGATTFSAVRKLNPSQTYSPFTPASVSHGLTIFYGELFVTARYAGDSNYQPASVTATFWNRDTIPPGAPANLRPALVGSTSFSVNWDDVVDQPTGYRAEYEVQLDSGPIITTPAPTRSFTGLAAGSTHTVKVRAKEAWGELPNRLASAWVSLMVPLPATAPDPSSTPRWVDINGDGIRDEVIGGNTNQFNYVVAETSSTTVTFSTWTSTFEPLIFPYYNYYTEGLNWFVGGWWNDDETTTTETIATVRPEFQIMTEPGYDFAICRAVINEQGQTVFRRVHTIPGNDRRLEMWMPDSFWPEDAFFAFPSVMARVSLPPVGTQLNIPGLGQITLRTGTGGASGTMTLPGGITINAGANGVTISNGTATVSVNGGTTSVNISLPGGYQVTGVSNGTVTISGPGGASIATGPGGTTITMPGGASITVNGSGAIGVTLPQGAGTLLGNGIDALGRVLGIDLGNSIGTRTKVVPQGGNPNSIIWEESSTVDLGNRPPGVYTVGSTSDTRGASETGPQPAPQNIVWFTLTIRPPTISLSGPALMWINDDTDSGDFGTGDVSSASSPNFSDSVVNGIRDLVDFFPVVLNLRDHVLAMPPGPDVKYKLKHAGGALNFVYSNLTSASAQSYQRQVLTTGFGSNFNQPAGEAQTQQITAAGVELAASFLTRIGNGTGNVILIEGRAQSSTALVLSVERADGTVISSFEMPLRISAVESMFRHLDLSTLNQEYDNNGNFISPSPAARVSQSGNPGDPYPDGMTNGKYFVFVHGYNVDGQRARGWNCEVFKRLYQMGSRARFVGVTWHGATGLDYHKAVYHAFQTGSVFGAQLSAFGVSGDVTVAAHSLGNMLVSHAIASGGFAPSRYFIINGAVPIEAYNYGQVDAVQREKMIEDDWRNRGTRFYAANWHELFKDTLADARNQLKWKNRFESVRTDIPATNFYSPGEDVVAKAETATAALLVSVLRQGFNVSRGAWTAQELIKGVNWTTSLGALFLERKQAGWNARILQYGINPGSEVTDEALKTEPYFERFLEQELMHTDWTVASAKAATGKVRNDMLARAIPALSYAAAVDQLPGLPPGRNFNMEADGRQGGWPTDGHSGSNANRWVHSDFRDVALTYVHPMYLKMIELGGL